MEWGDEMAGETLRPVLIEGEWKAAPSIGSFRAVDPKTGKETGDAYPVSDASVIERVLRAATRAAEEMEELPGATIGRFLRAYADRIDSRAGEIAEMAETETALPGKSRFLEVEIPRATDQMRQAAAAAETGAWREPIVDEATGIASLRVPLGGPVIVFGPNNFPVAFNSVSGGDFVAAVAAGNPVIAKGHPLHPGTTRLLAECAHEAARASSMPSGAVQVFYHIEPEAGLRLVADPRVGAVAYTGSRRNGLRLKEAADRAGRPVYLEMGSLNPVVVLPGALSEDADGIAEQYVASALLASGQFCTKPGLVLLPGGEGSEAFLDAVRTRFEALEPGWLLSSGVLEGLEAAVGSLLDAGARLLCGGERMPPPGFRFRNTLLRIEAGRFLSAPERFQVEAFGNAVLAVVADAPEQLLDVVRRLEGTLAASVYSGRSGEDDDLYSRLAPLLARRAGRLLNDKMPTGVAVVPSMLHGGPYPATGHPGFTAVGIPASIRRFSRPVCFDAVRQARLPEVLRQMMER